MVRIGLVAAVVVGLLILAGPLASGIADPSAEENAFNNTLAVQQAMEQAKYYLALTDYRKAVQVLEEQVGRINGNAVFLRLLREAYRAYIKELLLAQQTPLAEKYRQRLTIIDSSAAGDPALRPPGTVKNPAPDAKKEYYPQAKSEAGGPTFRAKTEDPFDLTNQRALTLADRQKLAQSYLALAQTEFKQRRFLQARMYYDQAYHADPNSVTTNHDWWAYSKLSYVFDRLAQAHLEPAHLPELQREVQAAIALAPVVKDYGHKLLTAIDERAKNPIPPAADGKYTICHNAANAQGWQVAETSHFRIFHKQTPAFVEKVAYVAEKTRYEMYRKWFGNAGPQWNPLCEVYLYATAQEYARATGVPTSTPGHSRILSEGGRIVGRRMDLHCDLATLLDAVLPHETTHVVLAGQFGPFPVPRWVDEGIAVLTEPAEQIERHRRNLVRGHRDGLLFSVRNLLSLNDYPQPRQISAFYAQSVVLVEFLSKQRGPHVFTTFVRDGLKEGYEAALRQHYRCDFAALQENWSRHLTAELHRLSPAVAER